MTARLSDLGGDPVGLLLGEPQRLQSGDLVGLGLDGFPISGVKALLSEKCFGPGLWSVAIDRLAHLGLPFVSCVVSKPIPMNAYGDGGEAGVACLSSALAIQVSTNFGGHSWTALAKPVFASASLVWARSHSAV